MSDQLLTTAATPLITLPGSPSVSDSPTLQDAQIILSLGISLYCFLSTPTRALSLSLTYKSLHTSRLSQRNAIDCPFSLLLYFHECSWEGTCLQGEKGEREMLYQEGTEFYYSLED